MSELHPVSRASNRINIDIDLESLPFMGVDIWNSFDFTWLNNDDQPEYAMLTIYVPCNAPNLIETKSLKLYLCSFANNKFANLSDVTKLLEQDISDAVGVKVRVTMANILVDFMRIAPYFDATNINLLEISCNEYAINSKLLNAEPDNIVVEDLCTDLLQFNNPATGKPNFGSVLISYSGPKIAREGLLQYIVSFRNHKILPEECIERIYCDILNICKPSKLLVEGRYTRRGGLEINPIRASEEYSEHNGRLFRQ